MSDKEWKKFDSQVQLTVFNARLAKDPRIVEIYEGEIVSFSIVLTSRREKHCDVWYDVLPRKFDADKCKYLKKGDMVSFTGFPCAREWASETGKKMAHEVTDASVIITPALLGELKERGWTPRAKTAANAPVKPAVKPVKTPKVAVVDPDDDDGDLF